MSNVQENIQALSRTPRLKPDGTGYDWRELDRWLQRIQRLLGAYPDGNKGVNLFTRRNTGNAMISFGDEGGGDDGWGGFPLQGPVGPEGKPGRGFPGQDGQDGEDGFSYPPVKGDQGPEGRIGPPGMDGEDSADFMMMPPGVDRMVSEALMGRYRYAGALADTGTITLPAITANYPAHGFIHCAHASTGAISESAEFEYGSTGEVQIIRGTANIEAGGATAGKISLGPVADANPVVIKNNLGGGVSVNVIIILWYG